MLNSSKKKFDEIPLISLRKELDDVKKELARWYDSYGKGILDFVEVSKRIENAAIKKEHIEQQISDILEHNKDISKENIEIKQIKQIIGNFSVIWENADFEERKKILRGFIKSVVVFKDQPSVIEFRMG
jgi:hypothetical protein